jgi:hypothetical protein
MRRSYDGRIYFDTFPEAEDPVREAAFNVRRFKALWARAALLGPRLDELLATHDAMGVMELLESPDGPLPL